MQFVTFIHAATGQPVAVNPALVRVVFRVTDDTSRIIFDEKHIVDVNGTVDKVTDQLG